MKNLTHNRQTGQVMIISVVTLSGILLAAAGIAGLLLVFQLRSANDAVNSAKAIFAADAGIEAATYCYFRGCNNPSTPENPDTPESFAEAIDFEPLGDTPREVYLNLYSSISANMLNITSEGLAAGGRVIRTLEAVFETP